MFDGQQNGKFKNINMFIKPFWPISKGETLVINLNELGVVWDKSLYPSLFGGGCTFKAEPFRRRTPNEYVIF